MPSLVATLPSALCAFLLIFEFLNPCLLEIWLTNGFQGCKALVLRVIFGFGSSEFELRKRKEEVVKSLEVGILGSVCRLGKRNGQDRKRNVLLLVLHHQIELR